MIIQEFMEAFRSHVPFENLLIRLSEVDDHQTIQCVAELVVHIQ